MDLVIVGDMAFAEIAAALPGPSCFRRGVTRSYHEWQQNGRIRPHAISAETVAAPVAVIDRDAAASADERIDADCRFAIASNAALWSAAPGLRLHKPLVFRAIPDRLLWVLTPHKLRGAGPCCESA